MNYRSGLLALSMSVLVASPVIAQDEEGTEGEESGGFMSSVTGAIGGFFGGVGDLFGSAGDSVGGLFSTPPPFEGRRPFYFSAMGSYLMPEDDRGLESGVGATVAVGKRMTDGLALEMTGYYLTGDAEKKAGLRDNGSATLTGFGVSALIFPFDSAPGIYGLLSVGPGSAENHPGAIPDYRGTYFDTGFGLLYPFSEKLLLRAEARYHMDSNNRSKSGVQTPPNDNREYYDGIFNIGVLIPLGTKVLPPEPEPEPVAEGPLDSDNDGVPDDMDKCPGTPAGAVVDADGCEADADGDGVPDSMDKCPDTPAGTKVGSDGCPLDSDGDGVPDEIDECPRTPAGAKVLANGCALQGDCRTPRPGEQVDANGCAVDKTFILRGVNFEFDSDRLTEEAKKILDQTGETLQAYADVDVEIAGHTDSTGTDQYNLGLSERRSIAVKNYLAARGVEPTRMTPTGYGESQPIDTNDTPEGQSKNRRVELRVQEEEGAAAAPAAAPAAAAPAAEAPAADEGLAEGEPAADDSLGAEEPAADEGMDTGEEPSF
jgi:OmpA-OmpF porin, OOP family